jgi:hypothetical protein
MTKYTHSTAQVVYGADQTFYFHNIQGRQYHSITLLHVCYLSLLLFINYDMCAGGFITSNKSPCPELGKFIKIIPLCIGDMFSAISLAY